MSTIKTKIEHSQKIIRKILEEFPKMGVGCSFGKDSMVVVDIARKIKPDIPIFSVMTMYKPIETINYLMVMQRTMHLNLTVFMVTNPIPIFAGQDSNFMTLKRAGTKVESIGSSEFFKKDTLKNPLHFIDPAKCCHLLKVIPAKYAIKKLGLGAYLSGIRNDEGETRANFQPIEKDGEIIKVNPIITWTELDVWKYLALNQIKPNPLYNEGYRSLGCLPCSAITGDDGPERAGRWQGKEKEECGLHKKEKQ